MKKNPDNQDQGTLFPPGRVILTKSAYARHRGCAPSAVSAALKEGRISAILVNGKEMIDQEAADSAWAISTRPRIDAHVPPPRGPRKESDTADDLRELRIKRERLNCEKLSMELDQRASLLVDRAEVDFILADVGSRLRQSFQNAADRLAPSLHGLQDLGAIHHAIDSALQGILRDFVESLDRAAHQLDTAAPLAPIEENSNQVAPMQIE
jgi:hypothetical protein